jgi:3D-(3,5/4)-trihydroxycyclohexane-1,2-dione acylhydrolase (decyclizing)
VFLGLPQDIQTYAFDFPVEMFGKRVWSIPRNRPDRSAIAAAARWIRESRRPVIFAGGGVRYSEATDALRAFAEQTGIPVAETHAGKGSSPDHPPARAAGVGTLAANVIAPEADLVIGIGTRFTDFPTASKTAFQDPGVRFVNINVAEFDAYKHAAVPLVGDARATLEELAVAIGDYSTSGEYRARVLALNREWDAEVGVSTPTASGTSSPRARSSARWKPRRIRATWS